MDRSDLAFDPSSYPFLQRLLHAFKRFWMALLGVLVAIIIIISGIVFYVQYSIRTESQLADAYSRALSQVGRISEAETNALFEQIVISSSESSIYHRLSKMILLRSEYLRLLGEHGFDAQSFAQDPKTQVLESDFRGLIAQSSGALQNYLLVNLAQILASQEKIDEAVVILDAIEGEGLFLAQETKADIFYADGQNQEAQNTYLQLIALLEEQGYNAEANAVRQKLSLFATD